MATEGVGRCNKQQEWSKEASGGGGQEHGSVGAASRAGCRGWVQDAKHRAPPLPPGGMTSHKISATSERSPPGGPPSPWS